MSKLMYAYEITEIAHPNFPQLHRIKALVDIDRDVHAGDLGGFVESYENLGDTLPLGNTHAWIYDNAICCGSGFVTQSGQLRDNAIVCGKALVSGDAVVSENAIIEDYATVVAGAVNGHARLSGNAAIFKNPESQYAPKIAGYARIMGRIGGRVMINGNTVVMPGQEINNPTENIVLVESAVQSIQYEKGAPDLTAPEKKRREPQR